MTIEVTSQTVELLDESEQWQSVSHTRLQITEDADDAVTEFSFRVKASMREKIPDDLLTLHRRVRVEQVAEGDTYALRGRIMSKPRQIQHEHYDEYEINCYDETHDATRYRFIDSWPKPGVETWDEVVTEAWELYGPSGITFEEVQSHEYGPSDIANPLNTLFDFMEEVAGRTGWIWYVKDDVLHFYDPSDKVSDVTLSRDLYRENVSIDEEMPEIANQVFVPAIRRIDDFEDEQETVTDRKQYFLQYQPRAEPEIWVDGVQIDPDDVAEDGDFEAEDAEVVWNQAEKFIRFHPGHIPAGDLDLLVRYDARLPVRARREHTESQALFGRIDHVIRRSPRPGIEEAEEIADSYLDDHALPVTSVSMNLNTSKVRAGEFVRVIIAEEGIDQMMPCTRLQRTWTPNDALQISATFQRAPVADKDMIIELFRRLNKLESQQTARDERVERYLEVTSTWQWSSEVDLFWSDVNYPAGEHQLKHLSRYDIEDGRTIYPS